MRCVARPGSHSCSAPRPCFAGCKGEHDHHDHGDHDDHGGAHVHDAPHGGTLIVLGEEHAHIELVLTPAENRVDLYALSAHAEHPVRLGHESIVVDVADEASWELVLKPVANTLTGETEGDTSQFSATDERLNGRKSLRGTVRRVDIRGATFENVPIPE